MRTIYQLLRKLKIKYGYDFADHFYRFYFKVMTLLLLSFLALSAKNGFPKMSFLFVSSAFSRKDMEKMENWEERKEDFINSCENDYVHYTVEQRKKCKSYINSISSIILSNGKDINEKLKKVSKKTEYLFYMVNSKHNKVDFNNLPTKMVVYMLPVNISRHKSNTNDINKLINKVSKKIIRSSFDGSQKSSLQLAHLYGKKNNSNKYTEVIIEGSISKKISFLTISNLRVVYVNELKCENIYISSGVLASMTNTYVRTQNFIIDTQTFTYYGTLPLLMADQFTLVDINTNNDSVPEYRIAYFDLFWGIQYRYDSNFEIYKYNWKVPYNFAKKLSLICHSYHIVIEALNKTLVNYPDINITVTDKNLINSPSIIPQLFGIDQISIESKGFDSISEKNWPSLVVNYDKSKYSLDLSKLDLDVKEESIYSYKPKNNGIGMGIIIAIASLLMIIIIIVVIVVIIKKKKTNKKASKENEIYEKTLLNDDNSNPYTNIYHDPVSNPLQQQQQQQEIYVYYPNPPYPPPPIVDY